MDMNYIGVILVVPDNERESYAQEIRSKPQEFCLIPSGLSTDDTVKRAVSEGTNVCPCVVASAAEKEALCEKAEEIGRSFMTIRIAAALNMRVLDTEGSLYTYIIKGRTAKETTALISDFWAFRATGGMLSKRLISSYISHKLLIWPDYSEYNSKISPSSYDLSLGDDYYYGGKIYTLCEKQPFLKIDPYDYAIVSSSETVNMPKDISGRFDVSVSLFCQGVILSNGTQIDPGFCGKLFCLLFNTSNKPIYLKRGDHFVTLEFCKLLEVTEPYHGKYNYKTSIVPYIPANALHGAINELKQDLDAIKKENSQLQSIFLGTLTLIITLIALLVTIR